MAAGPLMHVVLTPAPDVTDLDEWYGRLDEAVGLRSDTRWKGEGERLWADLPAEEADRILDRARTVLGESLEASTAEAEHGVMVTEAWAGRPIDE